MAAALATTALSTMRGMFQAASVASPPAKRSTPGGGSALSQAMHRGISEAHKELGKSNPAMSKALSGLGNAVPHLSAMTQSKGLGSLLVNSFKAASAMRQATRELSKMGSETGSKTGHAGGGEGGKTGRLVFKVGEIQRNWDPKGGAKGFHDLGSGKGKGAPSPAKNYGISIRVHGNQEQDHARSDGFRELGSKHGKGGASGKRSPGFQIIIGHQAKGRNRSGQDRSREGSADLGAPIHISFSRSGGTSSQMAEIRVGGLSISMQGASAASHSRKRANAFDGTGTQRKHASGSKAFPSLSSHTGSKARHRATPASAGRHAPGFSMTIGFSSHESSLATMPHGKTGQLGRARSRTL